jgi:DNA-binding Xre family transcriptional regulator
LAINVGDDYRNGCLAQAQNHATRERRAERDCRYALSQRTGVTQAALCRFMQGRRGLTTDTLDRLSEHLQMQVIAGRKQKGR